MSEGSFEIVVIGTGSNISSRLLQALSNIDKRYTVRLVTPDEMENARPSADIMFFDEMNLKYNSKVDIVKRPNRPYWRKSERW